jgi:tetratricopeptide (TPR) repeat protein
MDELSDWQLAQVLKDRADAILRTDPAEARRLADLAQEIAAASDDPLCRATAAWCAGNARFYGGYYVECLDLYRQAIPAFEQAGSSPEAGRLRANCVAVLTDLGRYEEALAEAESGRRALIPLGPTRFLASLEMNIAVLHRFLDDYGAALAACDRGRAVAAALGDTVRVARFDVNRALILDNLDSYRAAIATLVETFPVFERHGETLELARVRLNLGLLQTRLGHYRQALGILESARQGFAALGNEMEVAVVDWHRAGVYLKLNLLPEVIELAATARAVCAERGLIRQAALADSEAAQAYQRLGEPEEAGHLIARARTALAESGALPVQTAQFDVLEAGFHLANGASAEALALGRRALQTLEAGPFPIKRAQARLLIADCQRTLGHLEEAECAYTEALTVVGPAGLADLTYQAQLGLGQIAEARGDDATALAWYRQAMEAVTRASLGLGGGEFRSAYLADKLAAHQAAALLSLRAGDLAAAFAAAEAARVSAGLLLSLGADVPDLGSAVSGALQESTLHVMDEWAQRREEWNWRYSELERQRWAQESTPRPDRHGRGGLDVSKNPRNQVSDETEILHRLRATERRLADLGRSAGASHESGYYTPADLLTVQSRLAADEALLAYFVARDQVMGFWVDRQHAAALPDLASKEAIRQRLDRLRFALRRASDETEEHLGWFYRTLVAGLCHVPPFGDCAPFGDYADTSEAPGAFRDFRCLYIVPHDLLYHLPFHALHDGQRYLLGRCEIVYLPAASLLRAQTCEVSETLHCAQGKLSKVSQRALIVGHDCDGRLPAAPVEAQAIYDLLAATVAQTGVVPRLLLAGDATEARLREHAPDCSLLHLATHGVFRQDNPLFSALRLADGWLTLADVERLPLRQTWLATLSACETGAGDLRGGDLFGLSQAFLRAGAASLVASLWPVPDEATMQLMIGFYRRLAAGKSKAAALRAAQLALLADPAYRHPLHWAGFVLIGDDGAMSYRNSNTEKRDKE